MLARFGSGFDVDESTDLVDAVGPRQTEDEVTAVVVELDDLVATVEVTGDGEEWVFPRSMLPSDIVVDSVLTFDGLGAAATVVAHRPPGPSVESRLERGLNRRRQLLG